MKMRIAVALAAVLVSFPAIAAVDPMLSICCRAWEMDAGSGHLTVIHKDTRALLRLEVPKSDLSVIKKNDLVRITGDFKPGATVTVSYATKSPAGRSLTRTLHAFPMPAACCRVAWVDASRRLLILRDSDGANPQRVFMSDSISPKSLHAMEGAPAAVDAERRVAFIKIADGVIAGELQSDR